LLLARRGEPLLDIARMKITGLHNAANALAALALGEAAGLRLPAMLETLECFPGLAHRSAWIADIAGVRYLDDSKGTNVGATLAAVSGSDRPLVLIAGGDGKGQDFAPLAAAFKDKVRHVVLIGKDAAALESALRGTCTTERAATLEAAVRAAAGAARPGDTVLLSPACASLDMFRDYRHRGDVFAAAVRALAEPPSAPPPPAEPVP
jgi:UDP-N-acetylmuramoylalanine--D-glutamate ligase